MKVIAWNIVPDSLIDFDTTRQAINDPDGAGMSPGLLGVVLTPVGTDGELLARAREGIASDLREHGLQTLYDGAEIRDAGEEWTPGTRKRPKSWKRHEAAASTGKKSGKK